MERDTEHRHIPERTQETQKEALPTRDFIRGECSDVLNPRRALWQPSPEVRDASNVCAFMQEVTQRYGTDFPTYDAFYEWSVKYPEDFWRTWFDWCNLTYEGDPSVVLTYAPHPNPLPPGEGIRRMIDARWFPDVRLNFAENLLRFAKETPEREAIAFFGEDHTETHLTYGELFREVKRSSRIFDEHGIQCGDRVVALLPNIPEAVSAMLATAARGAIWSSVSPAFGEELVVNRFEQLHPKLLIAADRHVFRAKEHDNSEKIRAIRERIPSIEHMMLVHPNANDRCDQSDDAGLLYERHAFNHPLYILFSSGTTGKPKCIVHGAGGTLLNQLKQHRLHTDLKANDTLFFQTTTSWMMWNSLVCALGTGAKIVLYDGDPLARDGHVLFDIAQKERITVFGTSAGFLSTIEKRGLRPGGTHDLSSIRTILSTGSTLYGSQFDYIHAHVHPTAQLASTSGGTDIMGAFATGSPVLPVHREELQTRSLGYKVEVFDEKGDPAPPGARGELVCTAPFPSQPVMFWDDPDNKRYLDAYFRMYGPGIWHHGDIAEVTASGGMVIHGRSDDTLKPGGVRIGSAEITMQIEKIPEIMHSIAVGQKTEQGERIILFIVLKDGHELTEELERRIRAQIRLGASPYHVPAVILAVPEFPRTHNGKISTHAMRAVIHGKSVKNPDALANPESLEHFRSRPELMI